jgi:hypothetical protein
LCGKGFVAVCGEGEVKGDWRWDGVRWMRRLGRRGRVVIGADEDCVSDEDEDEIYDAHDSAMACV